MDTAILGVSTIGFNRLAMMAARDYWFDKKIRKFVFNVFLNLIPIERKLGRNVKPPSNKMTLDKTMKYCKDFLDKGNRALLIYPEGTRTRTGEIQPFKEGVALFAAKLNVPVVPAYVNGTFHAWKKGSFFLKPTKITAVIGSPLMPEEIRTLKSKNPKHFFRAVTKEIEEKVNQLKRDFHAKN